MVSKKSQSFLVMASLLIGLMFLGGPILAFAKEAQPQAGTLVLPKVSINKGSLDELQIVRGIGPVLAERIVEQRNAQGPFKSVEDVAQVKGIGKAKYERMKEQLVL